MVAKPVVLLPGLVQIKAHYTTDPDTGEKPINLLWFLQRAPVTLTQANCTTIANAFDPLWGNVWKNYGVSTASYIGSEVTDFSSNTGATWDNRGHFSPQTGVYASGMPPNVALLISLHTGERYRGGHGRIYLPWGSINSISADPAMATSALLTATTTAFGNLEPGMNGIAVGGGLTQRVYRKRTDPVNAHLVPLQSFTVQPMFASQRRRLRKAPHH